MIKIYFYIFLLYCEGVNNYESKNRNFGSAYSLVPKNIDVLFGENYKLKIKRALSQPGQFLSNEKLTIRSGEYFIKNVSVLGPARDETQVEIFMTDARKLKINATISESGNLINSPECVLIDPNGKLK